MKERSREIRSQSPVEKEEHYFYLWKVLFLRVVIQKEKRSSEGILRHPGKDAVEELLAEDLPKF